MLGQKTFPHNDLWRLANKPKLLPVVMLAFGNPIQIYMCMLYTPAPYFVQHFGSLDCHVYHVICFRHACLSNQTLCDSDRYSVIRHHCKQPFSSLPRNSCASWYASFISKGTWWSTIDASLPAQFLMMVQRSWWLSFILFSMTLDHLEFEVLHMPQLLDYLHQVPILHPICTNLKATWLYSGYCMVLTTKWAFVKFQNSYRGDVK